MRSISDLGSFTEKETNVTCAAINHHGDGTHPVAALHNVQHFAADYAIECLIKMIGSGKMAPSAVVICCETIIKLNKGANDNG